jgi:hypothetical protein
MTLPRTNLDDKSFAALVEEATKLIPHETRAWTDHNRHDPGITFIELFAWLAEMQQYYLDQIGPANYLKFLKLLGTQLREATSARADVTFNLRVEQRDDSMPPGAEGTGDNPNDGNQQVYPDVFIPSGTKLCLENDLVFETEEALVVVPVELEKVLSSSSAGVQDNTAVNRHEGLSFFAFDEDAAEGSRLYLGFSKRFFFDWCEVPGTYGNRLREFLVQELGLDWAAAARIRKPQKNTITVTWGSNEVKLDLQEKAQDDDSNNKQKKESAGEFVVRLDIGAGTVFEFDARQEESQLKVYRQSFRPGKPITITINLFEDYAISRGSHGEEPVEIVPSASVVWEYYRKLSDRKVATWVPLEVTKDETAMLSLSGRLHFTAPADMWPSVVPPFTDHLFWIRATVREAGYELPPRVDTILLNTVSAVERDTLSEVIEFSSTGRPNQCFDASSYLALKGSHQVQVRECDGYWQDWEQRDGLTRSQPDSPHYTIQHAALPGHVTIAFGDGKQGRIPPEGEENIRFISYLSRFEVLRLLGRSNGLPGQVFSLPHMPVVPASLIIQVGERVDRTHGTAGGVSSPPDGPGETCTDWCWRDWKRVNDFDASGPGDAHYSLNVETGEIRFGDGVNGDIPPVADNEETKNIRVISYQVGGGERGNVDAGQINALCDAITDLAPAKAARRFPAMVLALPSLFGDET